jgi:hypothetical protein
VSIAEEQQEVDLIGTVRIARVPLRLNLRRIFVQDVEDEVRLVLMGADDADVTGDVIGDQCVRADALLQAEVFAAVPCVDGGICVSMLLRILRFREARPIPPILPFRGVGQK